MQLFDALLNLLFPPIQHCPLCGGWSTNGQICPGCLVWLEERQAEHFCLRCGRPVNQGVKCADCVAGEWPFEVSRAVGPYSGPLKQGVHRFKYHNYQHLAQPLGKLMVQRVWIDPHYRQVDVVVPVPMSPGKLRLRGYNQAKLLAAVVAAGLNKPLVEALRKIADTAPQTGLDRTRRQQNLQGALVLGDNGSIWKKTVLLIDDVITTGSTISACAELLRQGGANRVLALTVAATPKYS